MKQIDFFELTLVHSLTKFFFKKIDKILYTDEICFISTFDEMRGIYNSYQENNNIIEIYKVFD